MSAATRRVLCVDDDANVLSALHRQLRHRYDVVPALGGVRALECLRDAGPFAVVLADLHMPGLDGRELLAAARTIAPDTVGLLMTGGDEHGSTGAGHLVFARVAKPCAPHVLWASLDAAIAHFEQRGSA